MDNQQGPTGIAQGTLLNVMWQPGWEGSLGENGYMCMYGWVPLLFSWKDHNIVNWLYCNIKLKALKKKVLEDTETFGEMETMYRIQAVSLIQYSFYQLKNLVSCQDRVKPELWSGRRMAASRAQGVEVSTVHLKGCQSKASCHHWSGPGGFKSSRAGAFPPVYVLFIFIFICSYVDSSYKIYIYEPKIIFNLILKFILCKNKN